VSSAFVDAFFYRSQALLEAGDAAADAETATAAFGGVLAVEAVTGTHLQVRALASHARRPGMQAHLALK
jgi:hypothetical protein